MIFCPACGGDVFLLGELGSLRWFRCRACGMDSSKSYARKRRKTKPKQKESDDGQG